MMWNRKRWLASMLTVTIALSDCAGMTAFATENATAVNSVSENTMVSDEIPLKEDLSTEVENPVSEAEKEKREESTNSEDPHPLQGADATSDADVKIQLPELHIGQIAQGETIPSADDDAFIYDRPVSFETADELILFTNYTIGIMPEYEEAGTLEWSILRGGKGMEVGSTSLFEEEDDWDNFETVSVSPFFVMKEITDTESGYYQMMALAPLEDAEEDAYDYYIRAAYYLETEDGKSENFYAAVTIPFVPQDAADVEEEQEDSASAEAILADDIQDESSVSENSTDTADDELSVTDSVGDDILSADESDGEGVSETVDPGNTEAEQTTEDDSTLSENSITGQDPVVEGEEAPPLEKEEDITLTLYKGTEPVKANIITAKYRITMSPGDTQKITAEAVPEMPQGDILWESSDETVATVARDDNGTATVTAVAEGFVRITASCRGTTASVTVDVVLDKQHPDNDKILDLSGDIRVAGFEKESDSLVYNGQKITQELRVYHNNTLLKEKTDYTLIYKNNVNAAEWNTAKAPSVTIKLKGQYQGNVTLYYTIKPVDINNIDGDDTKSPGYEQAVNYSKNLKIPTPVLTFGKKKLAVKKDFVCDYATLPEKYNEGDSYTPGQPYEYTVNGTGNFTGSFKIQLVVLKDKQLNFGSASVKLDKKQYEYHGVPLTRQDVRITEIKIGGQSLSETLYDYKVCASGTEGGYIMVSPSADGKAAGYCGCKKIALKLVGDRQIADAVPGVDWKDSVTFSQKIVDKNGGIFQDGSSLLAFSEEGEMKPLTEGIDYTLKYGNAKKAGKVTATFTGKGRYKGFLRMTYTITPNVAIRIFPGKNVTDNNGTYEVAYQKNGAVPELILKDQDYTVLKNKTDYTVRYKDNTAPGTMICAITGKGNYKGFEKTVTFKVTNADISKCTISIPDKAYNKNPNKWQSTVTIKDVNGQKLTAGKDYDKAVTYDYGQEQSPPAGTTITVTVTGLGCYEGTSITGTYRIFKTNISSLKVVIDPKEYTGEEITLNRDDIHVYASNSDKKKGLELWEDCYEIVEYKNNIKAGTAKVTLRGIGNYGGTKTYSFKIQKKKYEINHVNKINLDKANLSFALTEQDEAKRTLTATIMAETGETIANPTIIWSSSNSSVVAIEEIAGSATDYIEDGKRTVDISAMLILKKEGSVTITAVTQDGNRKAQCKVSVIDAPVLAEADTTIKEEIGKTYQLHMEFTSTQDPGKVKWESNNPDAVSVDAKGLLTMKKAGAAVIKAVYTSSGGRYIQQCYAVAIDPDEKRPEGRALIYEQEPGTTDDTPYLNKLLRHWGDYELEQYDYLYIPAGVYHIDPVPGGEDQFGHWKLGGIFVQHDQTLVMSPSALLVAIGNASDKYSMIVVPNQENVTIIGGQLIGDRKEHIGGGEAGHGIAINGSSNVRVSNVDVSQCWGDGIYLGYVDGKCSSNITIEDCNFHHNRRNNLSITDVTENVTIRNCQFNNANGTDPQFGIDIEPNSNVPTKRCEHIRIYDSTFKGNAKGSMGIMTRPGITVNDVLLDNCTLDGVFYNMTGTNVVLRKTKVKEVVGGSVKIEN